MSGRRVKRKAPEPPPEEKPSKEEYAVAKYIKDHVPGKKTKFMQHPVQYFTAARAVDALMDSPWASGEKKQPILFTDRQSVVDFLDLMLRHRFFHRAKKIAISDRDLRRKELKKLKKKEEEEKKKKDESESESEEEEKEAKKEEEGRKEEEAAEKSGTEEPTVDKGSAETDPSKAKKKKAGQEAAEKPKRRVKLDMHLEQVFVDGTDAYVWIYDPIPTHYWLLGMLIVFGIVAVCLFPLWPTKVREYVYYLSLAAAGFLVVILALSVMRVIVFSLVWLVTMGRHHLWLLPNLTEDVGFFASFWPLYQYEYKGPKDEKKKKKKKKGVEAEAAAEEKEKAVGEESQPTPEEPVEEAAAQDGEDQRDSEGGSEGSQHSTSTFEILDKDEEEAEATS